MDSQKDATENLGSSRCSSFRGTLKAGAKVFQDFAFFEFHKFYRDHKETVFEFIAEGDDMERLVGTADGFGSFAEGEHYGNGKIYVDAKYVDGVPFVSSGDGI
jgi:hypothetical protein